MSIAASKRPGEWVLRQSARRGRRIFLIGSAFVLLSLGMFVLELGHRLGALAACALLAIALFVRPHADRYADRHFLLLRGAVAERNVGETLNSLRADGWTVVHDIEQRYEGNIDHLVLGPAGVYLVETKLRRYENRDLTKAKRQAAKLFPEIGVFVNPVICLYTRSGKPFKTQGVWVVPGQELPGWLRQQRNRTAESTRVEQFVDKQAAGPEL